MSMKSLLTRTVIIVYVIIFDIGAKKHLVGRQINENEKKINIGKQEKEQRRRLKPNSVYYQKDKRDKKIKPSQSKPDQTELNSIE